MAYQHALLLLITLGLFHSYSMINIDARIGLIEHLLYDIVKRDIVDIKDQLETLQTSVPVVTVPSLMDENEPSPDKLQELIKGVDKKTRLMLKAFSFEKKQIREMKKDLLLTLERVNSATETIPVLAEQVTKQQATLDELPNYIEHDRETIAGLTEQVCNQQLRLDELLNGIDLERAQREQQAKTMSAVITRVSTSLNNKLDKPMQQTCPPNWERQLNSCIYYSRKTSSWFSAQKWCHSKDAILAEPHTSSAFRLLFENDEMGVRRWIGGSDLLEEGSFRWESSERKLQGLEWMPDEPNNFLGKEHCLEYLVDYYPGSLNDRNCDHQIHWVCEIKL